MIKPLLTTALKDLGELLPKLAVLEPALHTLADTMLACWQARGKVLIAGNGGSAADAMHLAEELSVRYQKNRKALAAIALCDPAAITCAGNDFGYEHIFARQVEALGNAGDVFVALTTSGNSPSIVRALEIARLQGLRTAGFLGNDGGRARALTDIPLIVPSDATARIQEAHKVLFHVLCEYIESRL